MHRIINRLRKLVYKYQIKISLNNKIVKKAMGVIGVWKSIWTMQQLL